MSQMHGDIWNDYSEENKTENMYKMMSAHIHQLILQGKTSFMIMIITHWSRVTHICVSKLTTIGSYNGLSPGRRQAIVDWTIDNKLQWNHNRN